jgi:E3 ubiquitin-protein ligase BOI-like protein
MDEITGGSLYLDGQVGRAPAVTGIGNSAFGEVDLTWNNDTCSYGFVQRKRARIAAEAPRFLESQRAQGLVPVGDVLARAVGSGAASTSGRMTNASGLPQDLLSTLYHQGTEIDALVRVQVRT